MKLAVFDLDYTIWKPEMYQLRGNPRLVPVSALQKRKSKLSDGLLRRAKTTKKDHVLADGSGSIIEVFDGAIHALSHIERLKKDGYPIQAAVASRTDEPKWAKTCMDHLTIPGAGNESVTLSKVFGDRIEIDYGSKVGHLERLQRRTGVALEDMAFFDNEQWNIRDVEGELPAKCYYTPDGMTQKAWKDALTDFGMDDC